MPDKETGKGNGKNKVAPIKPADAEAPQQQLIQVFAVTPGLMKQTISLLEDELPMSKARHVVQALESAPVVQVPPMQ